MTDQQQVGKDLQEKIQNSKMVVNVHDILNSGTFPGYKANAVAKAIHYIAQLHEALLKDMLDHPEAHKIPELLKLKQDRSDPSSAPAAEASH